MKPAPDRLAPLAAAAAELLRRNDRGGYTVPSPKLYPHQWAWDSAFAAIGWACLDPDRALTELEILLAGRWPDGRVPHILFHDLSGVYFPGPDFWRTERSSSITQPPVWATALRRIVERGADPARAHALLDAVDHSHRFFAAQRDPNAWGAVAVAHPWESGRDNCPAWDAAMQAVDPDRAPPFRRVDTERVDDPAERPTDDWYRRYATLVADIAANDFGPGPFAVYDPMMTALLARSEADLAHLARAADRPDLAAAADARHARLARGLIERLWDPAAGRFAFHDAASDTRSTPDVLAAYTPLLLDLPPAVRDRLWAGLEARYATPCPLPTAAPDAAAHQPRTYWRGPVWVNLAWLLAPRLSPAFGAAVRRRTLETVEAHGFREYYDPRDGGGLGARDFTWTAALVLDWLTPAGD